MTQISQLRDELVRDFRFSMTEQAHQSREDSRVQVYYGLAWDIFVSANGSGLVGLALKSSSSSPPPIKLKTYTSNRTYGCTHYQV